MRPSGMRNRVVALAAVSAFAVGMAGLAVVASRAGGSLPRLPSLSATGERAADMAAPAFAGVDYVVEGVLPALPTEAPAFRLGEHDDRGAVARLAEALGGIDGPVRKQGGMYLVTDAGRSLTLTVGTGAGAPWFLAMGCPDAAVSSAGNSVRSMGCASKPVTACTSASSEGPEGRTASASCSIAADAGAGSQPDQGSGASSGSSVEPCPPCPPGADCACRPAEPAPRRAVPPPTKPVPLPPPLPPGPPADIPDKAAAERIARDAFERLGMPLDTFRLEGGEWGWQATVAPAVGGLPVVGFGATLALGPKGEITNGNGFLGSPRHVGDYPLVGVQGGLDRLRQGPPVGPMPLYDGREPAVAPDAGPDHVVNLTGVHLALQREGDFLVPVYAFEVKGGGELPVPAVIDRYLAQVRPDEGRPEPAPSVTGSSGSCSGSASGVGAGAENANQPLTVDICVEPVRVKAGRPVTFKLTATDPDASIVDQCGSPTVAFGDGEPAQDDCAVACTLSLPLHPEKTARTRGELTKAYTHAYDKPGTYTATFRFQSGPCTHWSSQGEATTTVVVVD